MKEGEKKPRFRTTKELVSNIDEVLWSRLSICLRAYGGKGLCKSTYQFGRTLRRATNSSTFQEALGGFLAKESRTRTGAQAVESTARSEIAIQI